MPNNKKSLKIIRKAINVLQDTLFTEKLKTDQRKRIKLTLNLLYDAFNDTAGLPRNLTYKDTSGYLNAATSRLKQLKKDRDKIANGFATAIKILNAINGVLKLRK